MTAEELGGADVHTRISGVADHFAERRSARARASCARSYAICTANCRSSGTASNRKPPAYDPRDIYGIIPADSRIGYDVREVIARLVDASEFHEFKARYGTTLVCGFARIEGHPIGILANNGILF